MSKGKAKAPKDEKQPKLEFLIGIPSKHTKNAVFDEAILQWYAGHPVIKTTVVSNRVDWNRSVLWNTAKKVDANFIMIDTDVYPVTPYIDVRNYLNEDFGKGYDVVFAPLIGHDGKLLFGVANNEDLFKKTPYDVVYSGMGFVAFSKKLVETLPALTHIDIIEESLDMLKISPQIKDATLKVLTSSLDNIPPIVYDSLSQSLPIYFSYTAQLSEDSQFCRRMRKLGIKMAIDPRISCKHMTEVPFVFNPDDMKKLYEQEKEKAGKKNVEIPKFEEEDKNENKKTSN